MRILSALAVIGAVTAIELSEPRREVKKNKFGSMEVIDWFPSGMSKTVFLNNKDLLKDYER
jgi:hypothetical protein